MVKVLGIDESGRGPVAGPLVLCGYMIDEKNKGRLKEMGVKDSKLLSPKKRSELYEKLRDASADCRTVHISAAEIDLLRTEINLNRIEIEKMQFLINIMKPDICIVDAPEANTQNFKRKLVARLDTKCKIIAENFADKNHIEVGAASIIAKVERDEEIRRLHKIHGNFGSGYPSDPVTIAFLKNWLKRNKEFPDFVRKSWMTSQTLVREKEQTKIGKFM